MYNYKQRPITTGAFRQPWTNTLRASDFRDSRSRLGLKTSDSYAAGYATARFGSNAEMSVRSTNEFVATRGLEPGTAPPRNRPFGSSSASLPRPPIPLTSNPQQERMLATNASFASQSYTPSPVRAMAYQPPISNFKSICLNPARLSQPSLAVGGAGNPSFYPFPLGRHGWSTRMG